MKLMKPTALAAVLGIAAMVAGGTLASAAPSASATISARQANFKKMGGAMKALKDELGASADKAKMLAAAKTLATAAHAQPTMFPAGTGPSSGFKTDALPVIWTDRATFDTDMRKMIAEADKLVTVAGTGDAATVGAQFKVLGGACGACHRQFRKDQ